MSEFNLYDAVSAALVKQIKTYMPQVTVRPESVKHFTPDYPYVTYKIYDDYDRVLFNTVNEEVFDIHVQFKAVSNDEGKAKTLGHELRKLFFLQQPAYELFQQHIVAKDCNMIPSTDTFLDVDWQFMSGADYTFGIQDNFTDETQTGSIASVDPQINTKGAE